MGCKKHHASLLCLRTRAATSQYVRVVVCVTCCVWMGCHRSPQGVGLLLRAARPRCISWWLVSRRSRRCKRRTGAERGSRGRISAPRRPRRSPGAWRCGSVPRRCCGMGWSLSGTRPGPHHQSPSASHRVKEIEPPKPAAAPSWILRLGRHAAQVRCMALALGAASSAPSVV